MAKYQGLNPIMGDITIMASNEKNPQHEQHLYDIFSAVEKFVRVAVPQLVEDYLTQFEANLSIQLETYLNGEKTHHKHLAGAVAEMIGNAIKDTKITISIE